MHHRAHSKTKLNPQFQNPVIIIFKILLPMSDLKNVVVYSAIFKESVSHLRTIISLDFNVRLLRKPSMELLKMVQPDVRNMDYTSLGR